MHIQNSLLLLITADFLSKIIKLLLGSKIPVKYSLLRDLANYPNQTSLKKRDTRFEDKEYQLYKLVEEEQYISL